MIIRKSLLSVLAVPVLFACSASGGLSPSRPTSGNNGSGGAGAGLATGSGNSVSAAGQPQLAVTGGTGPVVSDVMNGECAKQDFNLARKPAEILILLDRSASMQDAPTGGTGKKWDLVVPGVNEVVTATDASVSWGLKVFPEGQGKTCVAGSVTNAIPVAVAPANAPAVTAAVSGTTAAGNGTPTADAVKAAVTYLKSLTDSNPKFILLATDGEPSCSGTVEDSKAARTDAVQAITDAATAGFKTFVVGVSTTKATATQALNDMAVAGQMARADTNPLATKFYLASTKDELVQSLEIITGQVSSCIFDLTSQPPDESNIAVHVNGVGAPRDASHSDGWDYTSADARQVEVYGSWCDQIKMAATNTVNFVFGCPGETVH